jgi:hypothetical protein
MEIQEYVYTHVYIIHAWHNILPGLICYLELNILPWGTGTALLHSNWISGLDVL